MIPARAPNQYGAGYTPHADHPRERETFLRRGGFGRGQVVLAATAAAVLTAALVVVLWLAFGSNRRSEVAVPPSSTTEVATIGSATTSQPRISLPGTDSQGFVAHPGARCDPGNPPAAMALTTQSALVICRAGPGNFYYRGVRLSDNAGIELANAVRSSGGFDVTNPTDGTRYQVRPNGLTILRPDGHAFSEPMVQYAST
jgi:hypothetical protein